MVEGFLFGPEGEPCLWCPELVRYTVPDSQEDDWSVNMEYGVSTIVWLEIFG